MKIIAYIETDFTEKFGIPRQSGLIDELKGRIVFESEYRKGEAFRGLEGFSHVWILWKFSEAQKENWSATVKPPRLGGKKRMGVFATRSPFRPNDIGLSCVRLEKIELNDDLGPVLYVAGVDLLNGTPIYDIKPYIPYTDCHPEAREGFVRETKDYALQVTFPEDLLQIFPEEKRKAIIEVLKQDPRPGYDTDEGRIYGMEFAGYNVRFQVQSQCAIVKDVRKI